MSHRPRKRFGQNFLHDPAVIGRIIATISPSGSEQLVEIGPGQGAITLPLLQQAGRLSVVELDRDLVGPLQARCADLGELIVYNADALRFDFCKLAETAPLRIIGNLPYNISTPLLFHLLAQHDCIHDMHFMLQKEVVERMAATPGSRQYGRLSVMLQYRCKVTHLFNIGPGAFSPPPKIKSAFVRLEPYAHPPVQVIDEGVFEQLVRQAFSQRRKTLRNALHGMLEAEAISALGIDPAARAETLAVGDFATLANRVATAG
ncbi:MAG TPA: 16S rRNA (adenine(1518)-N(6)/adenine(1519)-N(6))-dimethyltransferase RsmA [Gammaproteobacteria bacterium]|nr:16S rRNA (adenine(1518)-N(6)/adenine(1519)-N(6))-dimethyltransferase RsmA [Gammaproteobacteria bacterium]